MANEVKTPSALALRVATLLFPPAGLWLLWRGRRTLPRRIVGTAFILLYGAVYCYAIFQLLVMAGVLEREWRGGYLPKFTWHKTKPDFDALERSRMQQSQTRPAPAPAVAPYTNAYWSEFRGPQRNGHYEEQPILTNWPAAGLRLLWKQPCGGGYASFAIAEGLAFTLEQRRENEVIVAYELDTGREVWTHGWAARFTEYYSEEGPRATPTYNGGKIYAVGATGEFRCIEARSGKQIWAKNILTENGGSVPDYGVASSPLVVDDMLIVQTSAGSGKSVVGYDKRDGKLIWTAVDEQTGNASPVLVTLDGERQVIVSAATSTVGLRLTDGAVRWKFPWRVMSGDMPNAQPVMIATNRFVLSAGYFTGCAAFEVAKDGDTFATKALWQNKFLKNKFTSSVFWQGHIYGLDEDILTCLDAETGERKWKDGRYDYGQVLLASGHVVVLCGNGDLALVKATPQQFVELARVPAITGKTWNHPAIGGGRLLVRNCAEMACFEIGQPVNP